MTVTKLKGNRIQLGIQLQNGDELKRFAVKGLSAFIPGIRLGVDPGSFEVNLGVRGVAHCRFQAFSCTSIADIKVVIKVEKVVVDEISTKTATDSIFKLLGGKKLKFGGLCYEK